MKNEKIETNISDETHGIAPEIVNEALESEPLPEPEIEAPKKRRGRPAAPKLDETEIGGSAATKKRATKKQVYTNEARAKFAQQIMGLHYLAANATGLEDLLITEQQSEMLAESLITISAEYGLSMSGKTGALLQLAGTAAIIYVPKIIVIKQKIRARQESAPATVDHV